MLSRLAEFGGDDLEDPLLLDRGVTALRKTVLSNDTASFEFSGCLLTSVTRPSGFTSFTTMNPAAPDSSLRTVSIDASGS
jgi:hypothetical protein